MFAGCSEDDTQILLQQLVVLLGIDAAMVDAAQAEFKPFAQQAHPGIQINRIFELHGLIAARAAVAAFDAIRYALIMLITSSLKI